MYRKHFGLTRLPFTNGIDTEELFASHALRELQIRLAHLIELRGIGIITGESGSPRAMREARQQELLSAYGPDIDMSLPMQCRESHALRTWTGALPARKSAVMVQPCS